MLIEFATSDPKEAERRLRTAHPYYQDDFVDYVVQGVKDGIVLITNTLKALYSLMPSINAAEKIGGDIAAEIGKQLDQHIKETHNA